MNYQEEAISFVKSAFELLDKYKANPYFHSKNNVIRLRWPYGLRINDRGQLNLIMTVERRYGDEVSVVVGHAYGNKYTQITYIGRLLAKYLECLQLDNDGNRVDI